MIATHLHTYVATYMIYVATWFSLVQLLNVQANSYKVLNDDDKSVSILRHIDSIHCHLCYCVYHCMYAQHQRACTWEYYMKKELS